MTAVSPLSLAQSPDAIEETLEQQKLAFLSDPAPSANRRIHNLNKLQNALLDYKDLLLDAVNRDFSNRSHAETLLAEIYATLHGIAYNRKHLKRWMRPQRRQVPLTLMPASVKVVHQPLGVVGIVAPWNFPIFLCLSPLVGALAAGNRAMLKTSEFAPATSTVLKAMIESIFTNDEVAVIEGDVEVSAAFTSLPFDHLVFTGATSIGKIVMRAAAENLTPVTLELGGKSPVIIHNDFPIQEAATRLVFGKSMNGGQICVSPDYILCPKDRVTEFSYAFTKAFRKNYPNLLNNEDYTAVINDRQHSRLKNYLEDAKNKGAELISINPAEESFESSRKLPMTLVLNPNEDMLVMQEEIFGPILPIVPYNNIDEAIRYVNSKPRPLAIYYFDWNKERSEKILRQTHSGGVAINDTLNHVTADDIPFGGIGPSGMGHYHGKEGFLNFTKVKGVVRKGRFDATSLVAPPWNNTAFRFLLKFLEFRFRKAKI